MKNQFKVADVIEHKSTGSRYRINEFTVETAKLKNTDPSARLQNRQVMLGDLYKRFKLVNGHLEDSNVIGQINRIEAAVKFMREDIAVIKDRLNSIHGDCKRSLEFMHKKADELGNNVETLTETLREELGIGNDE